jgi:hypothetical protein
MDKNLLYAIAIFFVVLIVVSGVLYFYSKVQQSMKEEEFGEFLFTVDNFQTFLLVIIIVCVIIGGLIVIFTKSR